MSTPDRADTAAVIEEAVDRAAKYWGGPHDIEAVIFAKLLADDVKITRGQFQELVESSIAIDHADNHADLSRFGWPADCNWFTRAEFIRQQREEWYAPIMSAVVTATRAPRQLDELMQPAPLAAA